MRESGVMTTMALLLMRLSASVAQSSDNGPCERVLVEISAASSSAVSSHEEHSGKFYLVGEGLEFKPLYRSEGDYILQFIEEGDEYSTYEEPSTPDELYSSPNDISLEDSKDLESIAARVDRRSLQACGFWAIGMRGEGDIAMYPMIKVADCADDPTEIDEDSPWFHQDCIDCAQTEVGNVVITLEEYACGSFTFPPTPAPSTPLASSGDVPETPVSPLPGATPSPVDADTNLVSDGGEDEDEAENEEEDETETEEEDEEGDEDGDLDLTVVDEESGASKVGGLGVGLGVTVAVLSVAANMFANTMIQ